jgi:hypothetical protein
VLIHERLGAEQEVLLGVVKDKHDIIARARALGERPRRLQQRGRDCSVVTRTRCQGLIAVVDDQENASRGIGAGQDRHHVVHRSSGEVLTIAPVDTTAT